MVTLYTLLLLIAIALFIGAAYVELMKHRNKTGAAVDLAFALVVIAYLL